MKDSEQRRSEDLRHDLVSPQDVPRNSHGERERPFPPKLVSVVMPARNAASTIGQALEALAAQDYDGAWEVLVVDNGSTDSTRRLAESFVDRLPGLRVVDAGARPGLSYARNTGLGAARGDFIANCDADDVAEPGWLAGLVAQAADFDLVGGWSDRTALNDPRVVRVSSGREPRLPGGRGEQSFAQGNNLGVWRSLAEAVGGWDESFMHGCEDIDFSWKVRRQGYSVGFAENAVIQYRLRTDRHSTLRQSFNWGRADAQLYSRYSVVGMKRMSVYRWLRAVLGLSAMGLRYRGLDGPGRLGWWYEVGRRAGRLAGSWENRVWYP